MWPLIARALLFGSSVRRTVEDFLRMARNKMHPQPASGDIVLVQVDDKSLREIGDWPWPRGDAGQALSTELDRLGAERHRRRHHVPRRNPSPPSDQALAAALAERRATSPSPSQTRVGEGNGQAQAKGCRSRRFAGQVRGRVASSTAVQLAERRSGNCLRAERSKASSSRRLSSVIAGGRRQPAKTTSGSITASTRHHPDDQRERHPDRQGRRSRDRRQDGRVRHRQLHHRRPICRSPAGASAAESIIHVLGAETLKRGTPHRPRRGCPSLLARAGRGLAAIRRRGRSRYMALAAVGFLSLPIALEQCS